MASVKWSALAASIAAMTTELSGLSAGARNLGSNAISNVAGDMYADWEVNVTASTTPASTAYLALYFIQALDGTNYADGSSALAAPPTAWVGNFPLRAVTSAQRVVLRQTTLPATVFKPLLENNAGASLTQVSTNTLTFRSYNEQVV